MSNQRTDEAEQYEALVLKLESGARESCALRQLLEAEAVAANLRQNEMKLKVHYEIWSNETAVEVPRERGFT